MFWISLLLVQWSTDGNLAQPPQERTEPSGRLQVSARNPYFKLPREQFLLTGYLSATNPWFSAVAHPDQRPAKEILADLKGLSHAQKLGLREFLAGKGNYPVGALKLMEEILPVGHRDFLFRLLDDRDWVSKAVRVLAEAGDPSVVKPILARTRADRWTELMSLVRTDVPTFLREVRSSFAANRRDSAAYVLGGYGLLAEKEIREVAASGDATLRRAVFWGLSKADDANCQTLFIELADLADAGERSHLASRFVKDGPASADLLCRWLEDGGNRELVAADGLARIKSDKGVTALLAKYGGQPLPNAMAGRASRASSRATLAFIERHIPGGSKEEKLNALLLIHHGASQQPAPRRSGKLLFERVLKATYDANEEVRTKAMQLLPRLNRQIAKDGTRRLNGRLWELLSDRSDRVRTEAAHLLKEAPDAASLPRLRQRSRIEANASAKRAMLESIESIERVISKAGARPR